MEGGISGSHGVIFLITEGTKATKALRGVGWLNKGGLVFLELFVGSESL